MRIIPLALFTLLAPLSAQADASHDKKPLPSYADGKARVLFLTHSAGFRHGVVKRIEKGKKAIAERQLIAAARDHFVVDATQDCSQINKDNLKDYAAVVFYTTGSLPITETGRQALIDWVKAGGAFIGTHSATDTMYDFPAYGEMIGGYFDGHPWHQDVTIEIEQPTHPAVLHLGPSFVIKDEIYQFRNWSRDKLTVLMHLDTKSVKKKGKRKDADYGIAWCKDFGKGRVFYTGLGHRPEVWADPRFKRHMIAGIRWAMDARGQNALPPAGAKILFDGTDLDAWQKPNGDPAGWKIVDNCVQVVPGAKHLVTKEKFRDFRLHVEFNVPVTDRKGQGRGNSGVYLQWRYELQVLDSYGLVPKKSDCGALYKRKVPDVNACRPPGTWQHYDILFHAARFDDAGQKTNNAEITVVQNGVLIHDHVSIAGKTGAGHKEGAAPGPLMLQDHGNAVRFRNVWLLPL